MKLFLVLGSINAFLSVALGAFGAHVLEKKLSDKMLQVYHTAVQYEMFHALGLILIAVLYEKLGASSLINTAGWSMFIGIVLFSGSLYALSMSGIKILGAITPFGGLAFLLSWVLLIVAAFR